MRLHIKLSVTEIRRGAILQRKYEFHLKGLTNQGLE